MRSSSWWFGNFRIISLDFIERKKCFIAERRSLELKFMCEINLYKKSAETSLISKRKFKKKEQKKTLFKLMKILF